MCIKLKIVNYITTIIFTFLVFFCLAAVGYAQTKDINTLIQELKDKDYNVREKAAVKLGKLKDASAVVPLIEALTDEKSSVRYEVATALGNIKDVRALNPLINALKDEKASVRNAAIEAL